MTVDVKIFSGIESKPFLPGPILRLATNCRLPFRLAVIQDSFVQDSPDMFFDRELWLTLTRILSECVPGGRMVAGMNQSSLLGPRIDLSNCPSFGELEMREVVDRPPGILQFLSSDNLTRILMFTEYWVDVGGPQPYSDSYTYSIFSAEFMGSSILSMLQSENQWNISYGVVSGSEYVY